MRVAFQLALQNSKCVKNLISSSKKNRAKPSARYSGFVKESSTSYRGKKERSSKRPFSEENSN